MKHIWVVEVSGADKWSPAGRALASYAYFVKKTAQRAAQGLAAASPGLKWRVAKYVREAK